MTDLRSVGIASPRVESEQKVAGKAIYAGDVVLPGMLWVKVLRSPVAHARIKKIDMSQALTAPGIKTILTGGDFRGARIGKKIIDMPILADGVVRYVGEKVVAVAAESIQRRKRRSIPSMSTMRSCRRSSIRLKLWNLQHLCFIPI
jgi:CO/xanthine dehydrogenase Mo-binding subunit